MSLQMSVPTAQFFGLTNPGLPLIVTVGLAPIIVILMGSLEENMTKITLESTVQLTLRFSAPPMRVPQVNSGLDTFRDCKTTIR